MTLSMINNVENHLVGVVSKLYQVPLNQLRGVLLAWVVIKELNLIHFPADGPMAEV